MEIKGKFGTAICYANVIDVGAVEQIRRMLDCQFMEESRSIDKGVEGYEQINKGLPVDASFDDRLRESGRLSEVGAVGGLQSVSGQSGSGNRGGDSSGEVRKTEKQQQVNGSDAEGQSCSSVDEERIVKWSEEQDALMSSINLGVEKSNTGLLKEI